jgi:hypothetical protein
MRTHLQMRPWHAAGESFLTEKEVTDFGVPSQASSIRVHPERPVINAVRRVS